MGVVAKPFEVRRDRHTDTSNPAACWEWGAGKDRDGYGRVQFEGQWRMAHRVAYEAQHGPVSPDLQVDHLCHNRACVNPAHLEAVPPVINTQRREGRWGGPPDACRHGHPYTPENTYRPASGARVCRECGRRAAARYARRRAQAKAVTR